MIAKSWKFKFGVGIADHVDRIDRGLMLGEGGGRVLGVQARLLILNDAVFMADIIRIPPEQLRLHDPYPYLGLP